MEVRSKATKSRARARRTLCLRALARRLLGLGIVDDRMAWRRSRGDGQGLVVGVRQIMVAGAAGTVGVIAHRACERVVRHASLQKEIIGRRAVASTARGVLVVLLLGAVIQLVVAVLVAAAIVERHDGASRTRSFSGRDAGRSDYSTDGTLQKSSPLSCANFQRTGTRVDLEKFSLTATKFDPQKTAVHVAWTLHKPRMHLLLQLELLLVRLGFCSRREGRGLQGHGRGR